MAAVDWGVSKHDGKPVQLFTLTASSGATVTITTYGATIVSVNVPDRDGKLGDVMLGYDNLAAYEAHDASFGCVVGRFANRIANGKFELDGQEYKMIQNNGTNCLHGGTWGFAKKVWDVVNSTPSSLTLRHESPDMDEGFPGKLAVTIEYVLASPADSSTDAALFLRYGAECDKATVLNLTNHAYFNLCGHGSLEKSLPKVLDHIVTIRADNYIPTDANAIPFGAAESVEETPFDFRAPARVGDGIEQAHAQLVFANGYDHSYVMANGAPKEAPEGVPNGCMDLGVSLEGGVPRKTRPADCNVQDPSSGRFMETFTEEPAVQFYTANFLDSVKDIKGKEGVSGYGKHMGLCFESQHFPDSPNQPAFPTTVLRPGQTFTTETVYWFGVDK